MQYSKIRGLLQASRIDPEIWAIGACFPNFLALIREPSEKLPTPLLSIAWNDYFRLPSLV